tara:strand:+ start:440 stop:886 length:447 start_codon:yes stop_codon:yes gene_type:complete
MNYTNEIQTLGKALLGQTKAQDKTSDARRLLAVALQNDAVNLNNVEHSASLKLDITKAYPKGTGKDADENQKKAVSAVRQVLSTYKKGCELNISPNNFDTYSEWRKEVYNETATLTKKEQIIKWIENDKIELELSDLVAIIESYKAIK